jgi:serine/threonine protein kinase
MLIDEAKIAVRLNHGNIAQTFDLGKVGNDYFIVMEFVSGHTISQVFKKSAELKCKIPIPFGAFVVGEICQGLDYMHRRRDEFGKSLEIVHRDISPQNIIISESGNVKIVDFGIAQAAFKLSEIEGSGILKGKFAYMSPEQSEGLPTNFLSDIFSAGIVLWEMLTGRRLFKKKSNSETIEAVRKMVVHPPSAYRKEVPSSLDNIVLRALNRDSNTRYLTAADMALDLTKFLLAEYSHFKPMEISEFLGKIFKNENKMEEIGQEKTAHEESTAIEFTNSNNSLENDFSFFEDTLIVDPQELDFQSIFEEIDVEEESEITRSINGQFVKFYSDGIKDSEKIAANHVVQHPFPGRKDKPFGKRLKIWVKSRSIKEILFCAALLTIIILGIFFS